MYRKFMNIPRLREIVSSMVIVPTLLRLFHNMKLSGPLRVMGISPFNITSRLWNQVIYVTLLPLVLAMTKRRIFSNR